MSHDVAFCKTHLQVLCAHIGWGRTWTDTCQEDFMRLTNESSFKPMEIEAYAYDGCGQAACTYVKVIPLIVAKNEKLCIADAFKSRLLWQSLSLPLNRRALNDCSLFGVLLLCASRVALPRVLVTRGY
eukprot:4012343-Amphidinium_carterae.1